MGEVVNISLGSTSNLFDTFFYQHFKSLNEPDISLNRFFSNNNLTKPRCVHVDHSSASGPLSLVGATKIDIPVDHDAEISQIQTPIDSSEAEIQTWLSFHSTTPSFITYPGWNHRGVFDRFTYGIAACEEDSLHFTISEQVRKQTELCDAPSSFFITCDNSGWTGVAASLIPILQDDFNISLTCSLFDSSLELVGTKDSHYNHLSRSLLLSECSQAGYFIPLSFEFNHPASNIDGNNSLEINNSLLFSNFYFNLFKPLLLNEKLTVSHFLEPLCTQSRRSVFGGSVIFPSKFSNNQEDFISQFKSPISSSHEFYNLSYPIKFDCSPIEDGALFVAGGVESSMKTYQYFKSIFPSNYSRVYLSSLGNNSLENSELKFPSLFINQPSCFPISSLLSSSSLISPYIDLVSKSLGKVKKSLFVGDDYCPNLSDFESIKEHIASLNDLYLE
ncbi:hypothetical protein RCL1_005212 [Eukaryota sp. TZLM3-RCL]